ncbi:MAG: TonB-dependent receptor [Chitinispirillaceae bacterium]|nr:TonB-dependent receptor [Chitinispirillaceae bacterium]
MKKPVLSFRKDEPAMRDAILPFLRKIFLCFVGIILCITSFIAANDSCEATLKDAQKKYENGNFEEVLLLLTPCLNKELSKPVRVEAWRLVAMTYCATDNIDSARNAVKTLLIESPYEPRTLDHPVFIALVNEVKLSRQSTLVTSVSKKAENIREAPATVMIITDQDIRNRGYIDLDALFSDLPGFTVCRPFSITYTHFYQRGYRSNLIDRTLLLVDGREENDLWSNAIYNTRQYPISNVKRVEVLYGPASTMYGANALVGVINIITKDPDETPKDRPLSLNANVGGGSCKTGYIDATLSAKRKHVSFSASARHFRSDELDLSGYKEFDYDPSDYDGVDYKGLLSIDSAGAASLLADERYTEDNPYFDIIKNIRGDTVGVELSSIGIDSIRHWEKELLNKRLNGEPVGYSNLSEYWFVSGKLKIADFKIGGEFWRSKQGGTNYYNDKNEAGAKNGDLWIPRQSFIYADFQNDLNDKLSIMNSAQYKISVLDDETQAVYMANFSNYYLPVDSLLAPDSSLKARPYWIKQFFCQISRQFRNEFKTIWVPNKHFDFVGGVEARNSSIQGDYRKSTYYGADTPLSDTSVVENGVSSGDNLPGGNDFTVNDLGVYLQGALRLHSNITFTLGGRLDYNKIRKSGGYGLIFNPRIALVVTPGIFIGKVIYASAFQNASNWTKYSTNYNRLVNNPNLEPERVRNFEASLGVKLLENLFFDLAGFHSRYENAVGTGKYLLPTSDTTGQNQAIGELKISGLQSTFTWTFRNYNLFANYTYTYPKTDILADGEATGDYQRIGDIASHQENIGINALYFKKLNINIRMNIVGKRPVGEGTSVPDNPGEFPSYVIAHATVAWYDLLPGLDLQIICNNILNHEYFDPGVRSADGDFYSYRTPQKRRNFILRIMYGL